MTWCTYLRPQVQNQVFDHLSKRFGERQNVVEKVVAPPEAKDVDDPHTLKSNTCKIFSAELRCLKDGGGFLGLKGEE